MKVRHRQIYNSISLLVGDIFSIASALTFTFWLRFESSLMHSSRGTPDFQNYVQAFGLVIPIMIFVFRLQGLYLEEKVSSMAGEFKLIFKSVSATILLFVAATFFYRGFSFSRSYLVIAWIQIILFTFVTRVIIGSGFTFYRRRMNKFTEVLVIGANRHSARYAIRFEREPRHCTRVIGLLDDRLPAGKTYRRIPALGHPDHLEEILVKNPHINQVMIADSKLTHEAVLKMMLTCEKHLVSFKWFADSLGLMATQMRIQHEFGMPLLCVKEPPLTEWENRLIKRLMDVILASLTLGLLLPVFILIAIAIKRESKGPLFYRQERVGEDGRVFWLYKFRSMIPDAEAVSGPVWAKPDDHRSTRIGALLRRMNLDELPQLWNVLKGDMSLVGPRPERPHFVGRFKEDIPRYMGRHWIKSGLTGWAQVNGLRGNTSIEERTKYDLYYVENWSIFLDLKILFLTLFAFKNAY